MIREAGGVVTDLEGRPIDGLPVDLRTRTTLLCSAHQDLHRLGLELLHGGVDGPWGPERSSDG